MLLIACLICCFLTGCTLLPVAVTGGGVYIMHQLSSRDGPKGYLQDWVLHTSIKDHWKKAKLNPDIGLVVFGKRVMLYGYVKDARQYLNVAKKVPGVMHIVDFTTKQPFTKSNSLQDHIIKTRFKSGLLADLRIPSRNYLIKVDHGVVYVIGVAQNVDEQERLIKSISNLKGVRRVEYSIAVES